MRSFCPFPAMLASAAFGAAALALPAHGAEPPETKSWVDGFDDTPFLPGGEWRKHDSRRPQPRVVTPGDVGAADAEDGFISAPSDAVMLFDGADLSQFVGDDGAAPDWLVMDGVTKVPVRQSRNERNSLWTRQAFDDVQLHVEFRTPTDDDGEGQQKGNSGIYFLGKYEIQIMDSFENKTYADGHAGAVYGEAPPLVNASRPPGAWQSYDIVFEAPRFDDDGAVVSPAFATVFHNGVLVQHRTPFLGPSTYRERTPYTAHPSAGPIMIQDHTDQVSFRNIWARPLALPAPLTETP